jgi:hypothetical protein
VVADIDLDPQSGAARCLNLDHLEAFEHRQDIVVCLEPFTRRSPGEIAAMGIASPRKLPLFGIVNHFTY